MPLAGSLTVPPLDVPITVPPHESILRAVLVSVRLGF